MSLKRATNYCRLILLAAVLAAGACSGPGVPQNSEKFRIVEDDLGSPIRVPQDITRVVSLAPNLTEIIYAIGSGDKLVGVTTFCNYPEAALNVKKVGDTLKPNIETIVGLRPQIVFVTTASQLQSFSSVLKEQQIQVFVTNPDSVKGVFSGIRKIGQVLDKEKAAADLVSRLEARIREASSEAAGIEGTRNVFVQIDKSLFTVGKGSFISDALNEIGYHPVTDNIENPYPKISKELASALNPDLIIIPESVGNDGPNDVFRGSSAVRSGRVLMVDADKLSRPGPRFVDALEEIVRKDLDWKKGEKRE